MEGLVLAKKAYVIGTKDGIDDYNNGYPEPFAELVWVEPHETRNNARCKWEWIGDDVEYIDIRAKRRPQDDKYFFEGKIRDIESIRYRIEHREWLKEMKDLVENNKGRKVYIWSGQWQQYWRPEGNGYTNKISDVGIYDIEDAWRRTSHCGLEKQIRFEFVNPA